MGTAYWTDGYSNFGARVCKAVLYHPSCFSDFRILASTHTLPCAASVRFRSPSVKLKFEGSAPCILRTLMIAKEWDPGGDFIVCGT